MVGAYGSRLLGICLIWIAAVATALAAQPAAAQRRVALVIGNSGYTKVPPLANPENDAADIAAAVRKIGFEVVSGINVTKGQFEALLREFGTKAEGASAAFVFYAGHGLQARGNNYLIPVDASIENERDLDFSAVSLDLVLRQLSKAETKIVMLDACRNNPFARGLSRSLGTRAIDENLGLAVSTASDLGTFIAYATQPGNVARDGSGRNSPFTEKLKGHLATPGLSITDLMMDVRNEVAAATNGQQIPWEHSALAQKFYFVPGAAVVASARSQKQSEAAEAWSWIRTTGNPAVVEEFLRRFGDTPFASQAKTTLASLKAKPEAAQATVALPNLSSIALRYVKPTFDCKEHFTDAEVAICNNAELSILDNEMSRLYVAALQDASFAQRQSLASDQRKWVGTRDDCKTDAGCLSRAYQTRIAGLGVAVRGFSATPQAKAKPSFDCAQHYLPAEVAVCSDTKLARLDVDLDREYVDAVKRLGSARRHVLVVEQRQWLTARDTCAGDKTCLSLQYRARIGQLKAWK
ncbi:MAG: caspase family protein [Proteobacteria bacterium]|nr:caspase family protein [Pseudomonadota bacterium]